MQKLKYTIEVSPEEMTAELQAFLEAHNAQPLNETNTSELSPRLLADLDQASNAVSENEAGQSWDEVKSETRKWMQKALQDD